MVPPHRKPRPRRVIDTAVGRCQRGKQRANPQKPDQERSIPTTAPHQTTAHCPAVPRYSHGIRPDADIPCQRRGNHQRHDPRQGAKRQGPCRRAHFFRRLRRAFNPKIIPQAKMHRRQNPQPAIGQGRLTAHQISMLHQIRRPANGAVIRNNRMIATNANAVITRLKVKRRQHAAIVQPCQKHDRQHDERVVDSTRPHAPPIPPPYAPGTPPSIAFAASSMV